MTPRKNKEKLMDIGKTVADLVRESIETAGPRPVTPAYQDVSLAIQSALHPPTRIDPDDPGPAYDELKDKVEQGVKREGLL